MSYVDDWRFEVVKAAEVKIKLARELATVFDLDWDDDAIQRSLLTSKGLMTMGIVAAEMSLRRKESLPTPEEQDVRRLIDSALP